MSGRVPPKGPRALVSSMPAGTAQQPATLPGHLSSNSSSTSSLSPPTTRFSVLLPTAPRVLTNGGPKAANGPVVSGHGTNLKISLDSHPTENATSPSPTVKHADALAGSEPSHPPSQINGIHEMDDGERSRLFSEPSTSYLDRHTIAVPTHDSYSQPSSSCVDALFERPAPPPQPPSPAPPPPPSPYGDHGLFGQKVRISTSLASNKSGMQTSKSTMNTLLELNDGQANDTSDHTSATSTFPSPVRPAFRPPSPPATPPPPLPSNPPIPPRSPPPPPPPPSIPPPLPSSSHSPASSSTSTSTSLSRPSRSETSPSRFRRVFSPSYPPREPSADGASSSTSHDPSRSSPSSHSVPSSTPQSSVLSTSHKNPDPARVPPQTYSLPPPPPSWPPEKSEFQPSKNMKVLYDPVTDKDRDGRYRALIETIRAIPGQGDRIRDKGKGKEILMRFDGEVLEGEPEIIVRDPRKVPGFKKLPSLRPARGEFYEVKYEYDANSTGPPPPTSVLITNLSPLTPNQQIRRHFGVYGNIISFEPQIDKENGGALGIVFIKYGSHEDAKACVAKENGRRLSAASGLSFGSLAGGDGDEIRVVLDGEGLKLKAVLKELEEWKRKEREAKKRREKEAKLKEANANWGVKGGSTSTPNSAQTPLQNSKRPEPSHASDRHTSQHARQSGTHSQSSSAQPTQNHASLPPKPVSSGQGAIRKPPPALVRARMMIYRDQDASRQSLKAQTPSHSSSSTPMPGRPYHPRDGSRSPSPLSRKRNQVDEGARQKEHEDIFHELAKNGTDHIRIELAGNVREEEVRQYFEGFKVDKVLRDHRRWYVTFETADSARRAEMVLTSGVRTHAHRLVNISVHPPPESPLVSTKTCWRDDEMVEEAQKIIIKELTGLLEKDITERLIGTSIRRVVATERAKKQMEKADLGRVEGVVTAKEGKPAEKRSLKGLSFKKERKRIREEEEEEECIVEPETVQKVVKDEEVTENDVGARPKKRQRKEVKAIDKDVESEDDDDDDDDNKAQPVFVTEEVAKRKRVISHASLVPVKKKRKWHDEETEPVEVQPVIRTKASRKQIQAAIVREMLEATDESESDEPSHLESSLSPSRSPSPIRPLKRPPEVVRPPPGPPLDPFEIGLCQDDEDLYFAKLSLSSDDPLQKEEETPSAVPSPDTPPIRKHVTGSGRTEGYYKISHAEKSAYVAQYASRAAATETAAKIDAPQPQPIASSRSNRANARRRAQGLEEINQVQRAVALSKGETANELTFKFNQLQTRKKHLRFARSPIHDWGLYAMERISRGEMVIEYVGEIIRAQVAEKREKAYERQGIGSSYLFRIDEDLVVDATKKGNLGRLINHSCDPNCTAKIITIIGEKKIVIYAKQDIELGEEITYDYHFPIEQDKIPCLCGSVKCRGYLN